MRLKLSVLPLYANLVLFLGLASVLLWLYWGYALLLGPVAWVMGNKALAAWDAGEGSAAERTRIQTGRTSGMISTGFLGILLALLLSLGSLLTGVNRPAVANNTPAPDHDPDLAGRPQTLSAYRGRVVLLNFFAPWCGPCNAEASHLERDLWQRQRGHGVVVIGVDTGESGESAAATARFQAEHPLTYPLLVDQRHCTERLRRPRLPHKRPHRPPGDGALHRHRLRSRRDRPHSVRTAQRVRRDGCFDPAVAG